MSQLIYWDILKYCKQGDIKCFSLNVVLGKLDKLNITLTTNLQQMIDLVLLMKITSSGMQPPDWLNWEQRATCVCLWVSVCVYVCLSDTHTHTGMMVMPRLRTKPSLLPSGFVACSDFRHFIHLSVRFRFITVCSSSAFKNTTTSCNKQKKN